MTDRAMTDWIPVDPAKFNRLEKTNVGDVEIVVGMSPFDLPDAVRGYYEKDVDQFVIELKYLDSEEDCKEESHRSITLLVGEHSGRLYRILVDVKALQARAVGIQLTTEIPEQIKGAILEHAERSGSEQFKHSKVVRSVFLDKKDELLSKLQHI